MNEIRLNESGTSKLLVYLGEIPFKYAVQILQIIETENINQPTLTKND